MLFRIVGLLSCVVSCSLLISMEYKSSDSIIEEQSVCAAALTCNKELVRLLLKRGVRIDQKDSIYNTTPLEEVAQILEQRLNAISYSAESEEKNYKARSMILFLIMRGAEYRSDKFPKVTSYLKDLLAFKPQHLRLAAVLGLDGNVNNALAKGISPYYSGKKRESLTAVDLALKYDHKDLVALFHQWKQPKTKRDILHALNTPS